MKKERSLYQLIPLPFFLVISFLTSHSSFGQNYSGTVVNEVGEPFFNVRVSDTINQSFTYTDDNGYFSLEFQENSVYRFSFLGYEPVILNAADIKDTVELLPVSNLLNNVIVTSTKIQSVIDITDSNIIDYCITPTHIICLYSYKRNKFIGRYSFRLKTLQSHIIHGINPLSLFTDCFGNVQLVTKNETHVITIGETLSVQHTFSMKEFQSTLEPCLAVFDSAMVKAEYSNHNKRYTLGIKKKGNATYHPFFVAHDEEEEDAAQDLYEEIIATYSSKVNPQTNIITNKVWDGTMRELAVDYDMMVLVGFYDKILSGKIEITAIPFKEQLLTFDQTFDSIYVFDNNGNRLSSVSWSRLENENINGEIILDDFTGKFYFCVSSSRSARIDEINLESGLMTRRYQLITEGFIKNVSIANGWVYFLKSENGFYKLFRERL